MQNERILSSRLKEAGISLNPKALAKLWKYHQRLREANEDLNLTRIHNFETMVRKHYVDSLLPFRLLEEAGVEFRGRLVDIGTGPGLPGIPVALAYPHLHVILAEGRDRRVVFLNEMISELELTNAETFGHQVHDDSDIQANLAVTRALETIPKTLERCKGFLDNEGLLVFLKGPNCDEEIREAENQHDWTLLHDIAYDLPDSSDHRRVVVYQLHARERVLPKHILIQSRENDRYKQLIRLLQGKGVKKEGLALIHGKKVLKDIFPIVKAKTVAWIGKANFRSADAGPNEIKKQVNQTMELLSEVNIDAEHPLWLLSNELFAEINTGIDFPILLIKIEDFSIFDGITSEKALLLPLGDPENLGAAIRSAAAFGLQNVVLLTESAHPFHPKAIRASAGAVFQVNLFKGPSISELDRVSWGGESIVVLDKGGESIDGSEWKKANLLLVGEEGKGVPAALRKRRVSIPHKGNVESLNASVALSIALYEWTK